MSLCAFCLCLSRCLFPHPVSLAVPLPTPVCEVGLGPSPLPAAAHPDHLLSCSRGRSGGSGWRRCSYGGRRWVRGPGGRRGQEGRPAGGGAAGLFPHPVPSPQELSKRQVVAVGHLEVPGELAGLLRAVAGTSAPGGVVGAGARGDQAPHGLLCPQASGRARCPGWPLCGLPGFRLSPGSRCPWTSTTTPWPSLSGATSR